jgi:hypothetical protein
MMRASLAAVIIVSASGVVASPPATSETKLNAGEFVYRSVLDGLTDDGVSPALARELANSDDFIPKCDLCGMTRKALIAHGELKTAPIAKKGKGLPDDLLKRLQSEKGETRRAALRDLVQRYMDQGHAKLDVSADHQIALQKELEGMRKMGMAGLQQGRKYCPSCDGACRLTPKI